MAENDATRLRLIELRSVDGPVRVVRFGARVTLVTGFGDPRDVAAWIAAAAAGPRPAGVDGVVEVAGRELPFVALPPMLLPPQSTLLLTDDDVDRARWRALVPRLQRVEQRRDAVAAQRVREEAARAAAVVRFASLERRLADIEPALADTIERSDAAERHADNVEIVRTLLAAYDEAEAGASRPHQGALDLAEEWAVVHEQRRRLAAAAPALTVAAAKERVDIARAALEQAHRRRATPEDVARLHALQAVGVRAAAEHGDGAAAASPDYDAHGAHGVPGAGDDAPLDERDDALAAERETLHALGHSHSSFLLSLVERLSVDDDVARCEKLLAAAQAELERAETVAALPTAAELARRDLELRAAAAEILGRFPGDDVATELRDHRPGAPAFAAARVALRAGLVEAGVPFDGAGEDSIAGVARSWLADDDAKPHVDYRERVQALTDERDEVETQLRSEAAELVAVAARLRDLDRMLGELTLQESGLRADIAAPLGSRTPAEIEAAVHDALAEFTDGTRGPGRLPVVLGGFGAPFEPGARARTLGQLERMAEETQIVVVADRPEVEAWALTLGPDAVVWTPAVQEQQEARERAAAEAAEQARREAERRAVEEAEQRARYAGERLADVTPLRPAAAPAPVAPPPEPVAIVPEPAPAPVETPSPEPAPGPVAEDDDEVVLAERSDDPVIDLTAADAPVTPAPAGGWDGGDLEVHTATGSTGDDDWWVPIVTHHAPSRAARPVGEDLAQRRRRAGQIEADTRRRSERAGAPAPVYCDVHRNVATEMHCARCNLPFCEQCLAMLGEPPALHCVDCALELSGVRSHRAAPGA